MDIINYFVIGKELLQVLILKQKSISQQMGNDPH